MQRPRSHLLARSVGWWLCAPFARCTCGAHTWHWHMRVSLSCPSAIPPRSHLSSWFRDFPPLSRVESAPPNGLFRLNAALPRPCLCLCLLCPLFWALPFPLSLLALPSYVQWHWHLSHCTVLPPPQRTTWSRVTSRCLAVLFLELSFHSSLSFWACLGCCTMPPLNLDTSLLLAT